MFLLYCSMQRQHIGNLDEKDLLHPALLEPLDLPKQRSEVEMLSFQHVDCVVLHACFPDVREVCVHRTSSRYARRASFESPPDRGARSLGHAEKYNYATRHNATC